MRWRCVKCRSVVERENEMLTAVYCTKCLTWRKPIRPVGVRVRKMKPTSHADIVIAAAGEPIINREKYGTCIVRIPGSGCGCSHDHPLIIEQGPDQTFLFEEPGMAN